MDLNQRAVLVRGRFGALKKADVTAKLEAAGARIVSSLSKADLLIAGARPGAARDAAMAAGIEVLDGIAWMDHGRGMSETSALVLERLKALTQRDLLDDVAWTDNSIGEYSLVWGWQWQRVRRYFDAWEEADYTPLINAAKPLLSWPNRERPVTSDEIKRLLDTGSAPVLKLASSLTPRGPNAQDFKTSLALCGRVEDFPNVRRLVLSKFTPDQLRALLDTPIADQIVDIYLGYNELTPEHIDAIGESRVAAQLEVLTPYRAKLQGHGMAALARHSWPKLRELNLTHSHGGGDGLDALATADMPALEHLDLSEHNLKAADVRRWLKTAPYASGLRRLNFKYNDLKTAGARALAKFPFERLEVLGLSANEIGDDGLKAIVKSPHMRHLKELHVMGNHRKPLITDEGIAALASSEHMGALEHLDLTLNTFGWKSLVAMLGEPGLGSLRAVVATHNSNLDLSKSSPLQTLRCASPIQRLEFCHNSVKAPKRLAGMVGKAAWPDTLATLNLNSIPLNHASLVALCAHPVIRRLRNLVLFNTLTTPANIALLAQTPFERLRHIGLNPYKKPIDPESARTLVESSWFAGLERITVKLSGSAESDAIIRGAADRHDIEIMDY